MQQRLKGAKGNELHPNFKQNGKDFDFTQSKTAFAAQLPNHISRHFG